MLIFARIKDLFRIKRNRKENIEEFLKICIEKNKKNKIDLYMPSYKVLNRAMFNKKLRTFIVTIEYDTGYVPKDLKEWFKEIT